MQPIAKCVVNPRGGGKLADVGGERTVDLKLDLVKLPFGSQDNWV